MIYEYLKYTLLYIQINYSFIDIIIDLALYMACLIFTICDKLLLE